MEAKAFSKSQELPFSLALRIRHPSMNPTDISRELHIEPTHSFRVGERRDSRSHATASSVHGESYWLGALDPSSWSAGAWLSGFSNPGLAEKKLGRVADHSLGLVLTLLTTIGLVRVHASLFERIRAEGGQVSLLVALSSTLVSSFSLTPEVSRKFGELGITVEFETVSD
jgi:hypothetical protein